MLTDYFFLAVFLSQVLVISYFLPRQVLERVRYVVGRYPPERYPRLYPVSLPRARRAQSYYRLANQAVMVIGIGLIASGILAGGGELLGWDTGTVLFLYFMLQYSPLMIATTAGFTYFNLRRKPDRRATRKAELRRRRILDYVSPMLLGTVAAVYVAFVGFVAYVDTFGFPWFGGYMNVAFITLMNALFALLSWRVVYARHKDPYMSAPDRARMIEVTIASLSIISIATTIYTMLSISLGVIDMRHLSPIATSVYFQLVSVAALRRTRIDDVNFEVYREDRATAAWCANSNPPHRSGSSTQRA